MRNQFKIYIPYLFKQNVIKYVVSELPVFFVYFIMPCESFIPLGHVCTLF